MLTEFLYTYRQRLNQLLSSELSVDIVRLLSEKIDTFPDRAGDSEATWLFSARGLGNARSASSGIVSVRVLAGL